MKKENKTTEEVNKISKTISDFIFKLEMGIYTSQGSMDYLLDIMDDASSKENIQFISNCYNEIVETFKIILRHVDMLKNARDFYAKKLDILSNNEIKDEKETKQKIENCKRIVENKNKQIYKYVTGFINNSKHTDRKFLAEEYKQLLELKFEDA